MRNPALVLVLVLVLVPVRAFTQVTLPSPPPTNQITLGVVGLSGDRTSPEFLEYRDVPRGFVVPSLRLSGHGLGVDYDLAARDAGQDDQRFRAHVARGRWALSGRLDDIPHRLGDGRTIFGQGAPGEFPLANGLQRSLQERIEGLGASRLPVDYRFLSIFANDALRGGRDVRIGFLRRESDLKLSVVPRGDLTVHAYYGDRRREGDRVSGVGFGLRNAVEIAEPVDDEQQRIGVRAEWDRRWAVVTGSVQYDSYRNAVPRLVVDNPFRGTDSTAPGAQLGPNESTAAGAMRAEPGVAPDNEALTANAGAALRLPLRTRVTADFSVARWRQSDAPFSFTTTNATLLQFVPATLDGRIAIASETVQLTSAPWAGLSLRARYRRYEMHNRTPRITVPGVARLDAVFELVPRVSVPYSNTQTRAEASAGYRLGSWRLEGGARRDLFDRTFRETEQTTETTWTGALSTPLPADGHLRLHYEHGHRGFEAYDSRLSPGASRVNVHPVRSLGAGRRYDQAVRDRDAAGARVEMSPVEAVVLAASYALEAREYPLTAYGLVRTRAHVGSADASLAPGGRWSAHAFYAIERESSFQRVRHSPQPTISIDLRDIWDATLTDRVHSVGAGVDRELGSATTARLDASYQRADGFADFDSAPGGDPDLAEDIPEFDDVRWLSASAEVEHRVRAGWSLSGSVEWESQAFSDLADEGRPDYVPGAFVLAPRSYDYGVIVVAARITRRW